MTDRNTSYPEQSALQNQGGVDWAGVIRGIKIGGIKMRGYAKVDSAIANSIRGDCSAKDMRGYVFAEHHVAVSSTTSSHKIGLKIKASDTLRKAADLIEERAKQRDSGSRERSMSRTVAAFNAIYGTDITETQGWHFMELLKMVRSAQGAYVPDDFDDKVAYAALAAECEAVLRGGGSK